MRCRECSADVQAGATECPKCGVIVVQTKRPGGAISGRPLQFIWIADCSGSMSVDGKIQALNNAAREALPAMIEAAADNPEVRVLTRVLAFSDGAHWIGEQPIPLADFRWTDLTSAGLTDLGAAFELLAECLSVESMPGRAIPPVLVLLSDGQPTDEWQSALKRLLAQPWGSKAARIAIAIGRDADRDVLSAFVGSSTVEVLSANNPDALTHYIKWVSTEVLSNASTPNPAREEDTAVWKVGAHALNPPPPVVEKTESWITVW